MGQFWGHTPTACVSPLMGDFNSQILTISPSKEFQLNFKPQLTWYCVCKIRLWRLFGIFQVCLTVHENKCLYFESQHQVWFISFRSESVWIITSTIWFTWILVWPVEGNVALLCLFETYKVWQMWEWKELKCIVLKKIKIQNNISVKIICFDIYVHCACRSIWNSAIS